MTTHENKSQPLLVTVLAGAISSVGYLQSVFAVGLIWLLPSVKPSIPVQIKSKRKGSKSRRRRSAPPVLQNGVYRPPLPSLLSSSSQDSPRIRHVYFADSPTPIQTPVALPSLRYTAPAEDLPKAEISFRGSAGSTSIIPLDASPRSSSSTLAHMSAPNADSPIQDTGLRSNSTESYFSSRPSRCPNEVKTSWNRKLSKSGNATDSGGEANHSDQPYAGPSTPMNQLRRGSTGLILSWSKTKASPEIDAMSVSASAAPPSRSSSLSQGRPSTSNGIVSFVRTTKPQRRVSAPVRERTQPYAYPYFAIPPGQQPAAVAIAVKVVDTSEGPLGASAITDLANNEQAERRRRNVEAQASLGLGHKRPPQRRALSLTSSS